MKKIVIIQTVSCLKETLLIELSLLDDIDIMLAYSLEEARDIVDAHEDIFSMILDRDLPGSSYHDIYDFIEEKRLFTFVLSEYHDSGLTHIMQSRFAFDYVLKESMEALRYTIKTIHRLVKNDKTKVLVVDDSDSDRVLMSMIVKQQRYQCYQARDGQEALEILRQHHDIKIIIADIHMPNMGGVALLKYIRERKLQNELAIMGVSSDKESLYRYMKMGANEFMQKPFDKDEFMTRLNRLAETYEQIQELEELSSRDYLTQLRSRKYFMQEGTPLIYEASQKGYSCAVAMLDIDDFKLINDRYGHDTGDIVLQRLAKLLHGHFKGSDIVARYGGEEFCILMQDIDASSAYNVMESLRKKVQSESFRIVDTPKSHLISFTISIGFTTKVEDSLQKMLSHADSLLYNAKHSGKNNVCSCKSKDEVLV